MWQSPMMECFTLWPPLYGFDGAENIAGGKGEREISWYRSCLAFPSLLGSAPAALEVVAFPVEDNQL